jgi:hypothetical protein
MNMKNLPLKEVSISDIYNGIEPATYEIPIYQRNYAWERDEIEALVRDVHDAMIASKETYYIGTLVTFHKGDCVYEVIDGQQRLTTIYLIFKALGLTPKNKLTYRARKKSDITIKNLPNIDIDDIDAGIEKGFKDAKLAIEGVLTSLNERNNFADYFQNHVHIIHYKVPKDIDLNHYFEVMNSRGEQLEKHEIVKAQLISKLDDEQDREKFAMIWDTCSEMNVNVQQKIQDNIIFGPNLDDFMISYFDDIPSQEYSIKQPKSINELILDDSIVLESSKEHERPYTFQPIIDFPNFLLIVLKVTRMNESEFSPISFTLDDKELIKQFEDAFRNKKADSIKEFGYNLLKAKFLLDNYVVHHSNEDDTIGNNPWKLQYWQKEDKGYFRNLVQDNNDTQDKLIQLLSMFEVSFTPRQRKNYLFYIMLYLFRYDFRRHEKYCSFLQWLAEKYVKDIYLVQDNLNEINVPKPGSFDNKILSENKFNWEIANEKLDFVSIYGDGKDKSKGIPLFVFNYLDYKIWEKYASDLKGEKSKSDRMLFFETLGCKDFGLKVFDQFYFSRTRRSLEHFYPQANVFGENAIMDENQINCFGNYAMIGSAANSSGSNWSPIVKLDHYLDSSGKIQQISVASLKFMVMMQICKDNRNKEGHEWTFEDVKSHQEKMVAILIGKTENNP